MSKKTDYFSQHNFVGGGVGGGGVGNDVDVGQSIAYPQLGGVTNLAPVVLPTVPSSSTQPQVYFPMPSAAPEQNGPADNCARCSKRVVNGPGNVVVMIGCRHLMHASCFFAMVQAMQLQESCDTRIGGAEYCTTCYQNLPAGFRSEAANSRTDVIKYFCGNFIARYGSTTEFSLEFQDRELTLEQKRSLLGIKPSYFATDKTDYSRYVPGGGLTEDELVADLVARGGTLDAIFAVTSPAAFNVQHLYRIGIRSLEALRKLGYDTVKYGGQAYRTKCPFWMLHVIFGFNQQDLLAAYRPDTLLALKIIPRELWLCGVTMQLLIDDGLTKLSFLAYSETLLEPEQLLRFLDLNHGHLVRLGVRRSELVAANIKWSSSTDPTAVALLRAMPQ